jgi:hypothetical protein
MEKAKEKWGDWFPTYGKLSASSTVKFGVNVPFAEGWPRSALKK